MTSDYERSTRKARQPASSDFAKCPTGEDSHQLSVTVLFTSVTGTLNALRKAAQLAHQLGAHMQILVPHVVPYPLPIDKPRVDPEFRLRQLSNFCEQEAIGTRFDIRLCRDARRCIHDALLPHSVIVIGGRRSSWPLAYERRLAKSLTKAGHEVIFVHHNRHPERS